MRFEASVAAYAAKLNFISIFEKTFPLQFLFDWPQSTRKAAFPQVSVAATEGKQPEGRPDSPT